MRSFHGSLASIFLVACGCGPRSAENSNQSCASFSENITMDLDGVRIQQLKRVPEGPGAPSTINGGDSFDSTAAADDGRDHLQVSYGALGLGVGSRTPTDAQFRLEVRRYDTSTTPYKVTSLVGAYAGPGVPPAFSGTVNTVAVGERPGDDVCGTFDVVATGPDLVSSGTHTIHLTGTFHQVVPSPQAGAR